jgi:hypothetical protein
MLTCVRPSLAVAAAVLGFLVSSCGAEAPTIGPTGVDELTIPTPSPDPADFVEGVDNPWFPLEAGSRWTYRDGTGGLVVTQTVGDEPEHVAGVATRVVRTTTSDTDGRVIAERLDLFAQDAAGNVWQFGSRASGLGGARTWQAGESGAEAGLMMPAEPRVGDGFRIGYAAGLAEDRAEVIDLETSLSVPYDDFDGVLEIEKRTALEPDRVEARFYAPGVGLVLMEAGASRLELVSFTR